MSSVTLHHGDCLDILPTLAGFEAIVTDPPYGIPEKWDGEMVGSNGKSRLWVDGENEWDELIDNDFILSFTKYPCVIWGGNYYNLPPVRSWLIWDKIQKFSGADFEMAWTNLGIPPRTFRMSRIDAYVNKAKTRKIHPTEKPLPLMSWCIELAKLPQGSTILDPFMGSGATGVAAIELGYSFIGIEKRADYFDAASRRITAAQQQMVMPL